MNKLMNFLAVFENTTNPFKDGAEINFGTALLIALVAIVIVFVVLCLIIGAIKLLQLGTKNFLEKEKTNKEAKAVAPQYAPAKVNNTNIEDDDMMAAVLVATIDYAEETKKDVKLKSVKRIG